jgi:tetratricopeptide (TPR) repeat protein
MELFTWRKSSKKKEKSAMKSICSFFFVFIVCICMLTVSLKPRAALAETCEKWVAKVVSAQGTVEARREGETEWQAVELNGTYCPGDTIRVDKRSRADIALVNQPVIRLDQNTTITLGGLKDEQTSLIDLLGGAAHFFSRVARNLEVRTAFVNAGVEGTEFFIRVDEDKTSISIFEGKVLASNEAGSLAVTSGQSAEAEAGKAPALRVVVRPRDAVQWALYFPPVIYYRPADFQGFPETDWRRMAQKSIDAYWMGDLTGAFSGIEEIPEDIPDPHFFTYRASLLLTVGRVDEAGGDIERALGLDPENSDAFALRSIIAVAQNEKEGALNLAKEAVETDPDSATARIALSYAQQANFNLEGALSSLKDAVRLGPENALAWARLAELWMSFGELDEALEAAKKAVALNPDLPRTQTVLGYAYLTQGKTIEARGAFEKAIELDSAEPLSRLGLGLSKIREGNLDEGRREIEIAVSLDPDNSIIRSYLGKSYFEEKRDKLSMDQFEMAKTLDPSDPTPFFYDSIRKQTENQPVEAFRDQQSATDLNDNRAVYRSRLLLDSDLAARSASLARIYSDLGFQQLALVEGWKSVNIDPGNYSAHRFLADTYSVLPRHEIARVSELLQSQLLQPINITPVQPRLGESNLFIISGGGPADLSFNEFNPLFLRDRVALQASGFVGENSTVGEEVTVSGLYKKASVSVGQYHHETDGYRENNDLTDDIYNAFVQMELTHKTSVQAEFRHRDFERGDLSLLFLPGDFLPKLRQEDETNMVRVGFHHAFSPGSDLIGNFMYQEADRSLLDRDDFPPPIPFQDVFKIDRDEDALGGELQYLSGAKYIKFTGGVGHFDRESEEVITEEVFDISVTPPDLLDRDEQSVESDIRHTNLYLYSYINFPENVTFTIGGSADFFDEDREDALPEKDEDQFNPKLGIIWNPFVNTTVRGAVFRTLKRLLITDQTLEPTQVAGFNQFFDDFNATKSWRYGIAVDQKFSQSLYGGAEYSEREQEVPFRLIQSGTIELRKSDWDESLFRAYLYWTAHEWLALSAEYLYEKFEREAGLFTFGAKDVETQRVPLGINLYHPSGFIARLKTTYYDQQGSFDRQDALGTFIDGEDDFWLVDASISYRLPKRFGFITVGAKNLFDDSFQFFDTNPVSPVIQPDSLFFARLTLSI